MSIKLLQNLKNLSGSNDKKAFIERNKDDKLFLELLDFLLNPYIRTGVSKKKIRKDVNLTPTTQLYTYSDVMTYLKDNNTGRDIDIANLQYFLKGVDVEELDLAIGLITKNYPMGVQAATVNSVVPNHIPTFNPMLAQEYSKHITKFKNKPFTLTMKLDGARCLAVKDNNSVTLYSRQGLPFVGITEVVQAYSDLPNGVYDGELIAKRLPNETTAELYRRTMSLVNSNNEVVDIQHILFDYIELDDWKTSSSTTPYIQRFDKLKQIVENANKEELQLVEVLYKGTDIDIIPTMLRQVSERDFEGVMINFDDSPYIFKRGTALLKAKEFDSADLVVLDVFEGSNKYENMLGGVTVEYRGNVVEVGSGFTDAERRRFWQNPSEIIGEIIRVDYREQTQNKKGESSMRFPTFGGILQGKTIEDVKYSDND